MKCRKCGRVLPDDYVYCPYDRAKLTLAERKPKTRGNGQGTVYKRADGKYIAEVVLAYYMENGKTRRKTRSKVFVKKSDAVAALPSLREQIVKSADMTLHDLYEVYTKSNDYYALSKSQAQKLGYAWTRLAPIEFRGITTLTVDELQSTIDSAVSTYYPARDMKVLLSHLYTIAIRKEIVSMNKTEYIELPDAPKAKRECWTEEEVGKMWEDYRTHPFTGLPLIMCYCGLRHGELARIELENIHMDESYMIGGMKTEAGIDREIMIPDKIKPVIQYFMSVSKNGLIYGMNDDNFYSQYWAMISRTGLRELPPHTCRHYYFSQLTAAGVHVGIITETGGHASFVTTMKNYVRIPREDKLKAVQLIK